ncbi:hypothetical protein Vadar_033755 [Vaccinium darrowii]|uniref:Uncharacterized protein n=1 Tax=Vaccinium darrowii TaxID=229202 RepID=A0ACB7Y4W9_9ERIC|nr:hypothetical protein Vadar_033755 [Vaccinium darrowii]
MVEESFGDAEAAIPVQNVGEDKEMAELLGTYAFVFVGCASALAHRDEPLSIKGTAILWGLDLVMVKYTLGHISGAYINPSANIAFAVARRQITGASMNLWVYIVGPTLGATIATLTYSILQVPEPEKSTESIKFIYNDLYTEPSSETTQLEKVKKFLNVA